MVLQFSITFPIENIETRVPWLRHGAQRWRSSWWRRWSGWFSQGLSWVLLGSNGFKLFFCREHLESFGIISSDCFQVWLAMFPTLIPVEPWKCAVSILCMRATLGSEESYEDESEEDEVSNKGGDWIKNILGLEQPNMSNTYQQMNTNEGLHNWSNLRFISSQFSLLQQGKQCWDDSTVLGC